MYAECQIDSCAAILQIIYPGSYLRELKNERIAKGFDRLARVYTGLSRIVFYNSLQHAQEHFLPSIHANDNILILGGGSGDLLKSLLKRHSRITVDYIDISRTMIELAQKKTQNPLNVNFIVGTEQQIGDRMYSVVITNFYLDLFTDATLQQVIRKIKTHLSPDARWLAADFVEEKGWHTVMLRCMYLFFKMVAQIEATRLPDWSSAVKKAGMQELDSKKFYHGFIKSSVYKFVTSPQG